jgi:hypothetical protein
MPTLNKTKARPKQGQNILSRTIKLMKTGNDAWVKLTEKVQYTMLGFHHDTEKLLFVEDYRKLKCCPINPNPNYLWKDIHLSKGSSFELKEFTLFQKAYTMNHNKIPNML